MSQSTFPPLTLSEWQPTRDTIQAYAQVVGKIRQAMTPPQKYWYHISLRAAAAGLTTTPIPAGDLTFELLLDLTGHHLILTTSHGDWFEVDFDSQTAREFYEDVLLVLQPLGIEPAVDANQFDDERTGTYDADAVEDFWQAASQIDAVLKQFKGELREETSPVQLWPHHCDLALLWFSGRKVPGVDPDDEENADEQMNFGFSTGDSGIPDPYFYITAYPWPEGLEQRPLPAGAVWHTQGWKGALLLYEKLVETEDAKGRLLEFLRTVQRARSGMMK